MAEAMCDPLLVVAIDFGTAYSGYAFQFMHEYNAKDPTVIAAPQAWSDGKKQVMSLKTPTSLLLTPDIEIDSFGYEADRKYTELCEENQEKDWYFYRRFKMKLQDRGGLTKSSQLEDESLKSIPAIDVFSKSLQCLKQHLMSELDRKSKVIKEDDILWVLSVPAIWDDSAKQFMREAAIRAGLRNENLMIALEPEAASLYCQYLPVNRFAIGGQQSRMSLAVAGTVIMVVDLGGGTADITVHEKLANGKLREVHNACGGPWGGTAVDAFFIQLFTSIIGGFAMSEFMHNHRADYLDLMMEFEAIKRTVDMKTEKSINIKVPSALYDIVKDPELLGKTLKEAIADSPHSSSIKLVGDKMKMNPDIVRSLFQTVADKICQQMSKCIAEARSAHNVSMVLMVGGFSESPYIQEVIKNMFEGKNNIRIVIPQEAGLAVLKGAVIFGRQPDSISARILRYTYGAEITPVFDPELHDERKRTEDGTRCNNVFQPFASMGLEVNIGYKVERIYNTITSEQDNIKLKIFCSDTVNTKYTTDEGCRFLGTMELKLKTPTDQSQDLNVIYEFGSTELKLSGRELASGKVCETVLKMID